MSTKKQKKGRSSQPEKSPSNILDFSPKPVSHPLPLESDPAITRQALKVIDCVLDAPEQQDSPFVNAFGDISDDLLLEIIQMVLFAEPSPAMEASACLSLLPTRKVDIMLDTLLRSPNIDPVRRCILETIVKERNEAYKLLGQEGFALNLPENPEVALRRLIERTEEIDLPIEEAWALLSEEAMVSCIDLGYQATIPAFGRLLAHVADLVPTSVALKILQKMTQVSQKHLSLLVRALAMHPDERVRNALRAQEKWLTKHGISLNEILFCESKQPEVQVYLCSTEASGQYTMLVNQRSSLQRLRSVFFHIDTWLQGLCLTQGTSCAMVSDDVAKMRVAEFLEDQGVHAVEQTDISLARARRIIEDAAEFSLKNDFPLPTQYNFWKSIFRYVPAEEKGTGIPFGFDCAECHNGIEPSQVMDQLGDGTMSRRVLLCTKCRRKKKKCAGCGKLLLNYTSWRSYSQKKHCVELFCRICTMDRVLNLLDKSLETEDFSLTLDDILTLIELSPSPNLMDAVGTILNRVLNVYPRDPQMPYSYIYERYTDILEKKGQYVQAAENFQKAFDEISAEDELPTKANIRRLAFLTILAGNKERGTKILTEEISVSPKDFISYETLVQGLMLTKHFREAEKYLNEAFEVARKHGISKGRQKSLLKLKQTLYESFPADLLPRQDLLWE